MRVISALAPVVALCVSYILGTAFAAALGLEPATVGAPVAVVLFGTVLLFFSVGESRRRTTRQLVPSLRFDLRLAGTALVIGVLAAVVLAPVVEKGKATASAGHLLILALPALLMLPLARLFRARAMHRTKERVVVVVRARRRCRRSTPVSPPHRYPCWHRRRQGFWSCHRWFGRFEQPVRASPGGPGSSRLFELAVSRMRRTVAAIGPQGVYFGRPPAI